MSHGLDLSDADVDDVDHKPRFKLEPFATISYSTNARWLIKGLLACTGLATIYGPPKQYKSFVALDIALHVAAGKPWAGRRVRQGAVVYICAEGANGFADRVAANREHFELPDDLPFFLIRAKPNLGTEQGDTLDLIADIEPYANAFGPLAAVFIDTLVRTLAGGSENDDGMRYFTDNTEAIAERFNCLSVAVHHTGKDTARGMRGSSSLHGAVVSAWKVEKTRSFQARITLEDAKDGESGLAWTADLKRFVFGHDEDGDEQSVLLVESVSDPARETKAEEVTKSDAKARGKPPAQLRLFLACLDTAMASVGRIGRPFHDGPQIRVVEQKSVRDEYFLRRGDDATPDAKRKSFDNQVKAALDRRIICVQETDSEKLVWRLQ